MEAASNLIEEADPDFFTSRILASESGYSLGTLNKRLISVENAFIWLIEQRQKKQIKNAIQIIEGFDPASPLRALVENLTDTFFDTMKKVNPKVIRFYEHRIALKMGLNEDYDRADAIVQPLLIASRNNTSNTFRQINEIEMQLILRSVLFLLERPFVHDDPIAGTIEHRRMAIENAVRMLGR